MIVRPDWLRLRTLVRAMAVEPLLRSLFIAIWTAGVLGWLADDSGVSVTAALLPLALPLAIVIVTMAAERDGSDALAAQPAAGWNPSEGRVQAPGRQG